MTDLPPASLVFDDTQHYDCQNCPARCCRFPWQIQLSKAEEMSLRKLDWVQARLKQFQVDFIAINAENSVMPRVEYKKGDRGCFFLDEDNLCLLQKKEGHAALPKTCQAYPFAFFEDKAPEATQPKTVYVGNSFFCPSIMNNDGEPMREAAPARFAQPDSVKVVSQLPEQVMLSPQKSLSKSAYMAFSTYLENQLSLPDISVPQVLRQAQQMVMALTHNPALPGLIEADFLNAQLNASTQPAAPWKNNVPRQTITGKTFITLGILRSISLSLDPAASTAKAPGQFSLSDKIKILTFRLNLLFERETIRLWDIPTPVPMQAAKRIQVPEQSEAFQAEFRRYYKALFQSKMVWCLKDEPLPKVFLLLASVYATSLRMTRYVAYSQGHTEATHSDLKQALGFASLMLQSQNRLQCDSLTQMLNQITDSLALFENTFDRVLFCESD